MQCAGAQPMALGCGFVTWRWASLRAAMGGGGAGPAAAGPLLQALQLLAGGA